MRTKEAIIIDKLEEVFVGVPPKVINLMYDNLLISKVDEMMEEYAVQTGSNFHNALELLKKLVKTEAIGVIQYEAEVKLFLETLNII